MNALYHIAILEGYLSQHPELPTAVQNAIAFFKQGATATPEVEQRKKKRKHVSPEARAANLVKLAKMREVQQAKQAAIWTDELLEKIRSSLAGGKPVSEISKMTGLKEHRIYSAIHRFGLK